MAGADVLIVVPARGGSKGLPRKNARRLGGLPLLGWTAQAVAASGVSGARCVLSTDDPEIAQIGAGVGLEVPFMRPAELASDTASAESVALHAVEWMESSYGSTPSAVMWLQPTSPFRPPAMIGRAVDALAAGDAPGVVGVKPIYRSLRALFHADGSGRLIPLDAAAPAQARRQEGATLYTPNGALYLVRTDVLRRDGSLFPAGAAALVMDQVASIDIDDETDWAIAEAVLAGRLAWRHGDDSNGHV